MSERNAVVLLSGGMDSGAALLHTLKKKKEGYYSAIYSITFKYGSKEEKYSLKAIKKIAEISRIDHMFIELPFLGEFAKKAGATLVDQETHVPLLKSSELDDSTITSESARSVYIPCRNTVFLAIAASFAESLGGESDILWGGDLEEAATFPDNTQEFVNAYAEVLKYAALNAKLHLVSPLINKNKDDIAREAHQIEQDLGMELMRHTMSCYEPKGERDGQIIHCGGCESCARRHRGFLKGIAMDPTLYAQQPE